MSINPLKIMSVEFPVNDHRPTDLMNGVTVLLNQIYEGDLRRGVRVLEKITAALKEDGQSSE